MKRTIKIMVLFALLINTLTIPNPVNADGGGTSTDLIAHDDGFYRKTVVPVFTKFNNTANIAINFDLGVNTERGFMLFNISSIPDTATITNVALLYSGQQHMIDCNITDMMINPNTASAEDAYNKIGNGTVYASPAGFPVDADNQIVVLADDPTDQIIIDLTANLTGTWFALGFTQNDETIDPGAQTLIWGEQNATAAPRPTLRVLYMETPVSYTFSDTYYENGTLRVPAVNVTASGPGYTDEFNTSGGTTELYEPEPTLFFWSIGTASRRIYSIGAENFTVTYPDGVFDTYVFTVRDFTGRTALGDTYLEAWRIIGGVDTLIERQIIDVHNEVPLNMVVGATYTIRVRFYDNSSLVWGQFVPGDSTVFTIVLRGVEITEQAYLVGNFLFVEITRPITTQITVDYLTSRNTTIWSNVTVIIRNGAVVATQSFSNESYTYNLGGLDANTSYTVLVEGEHTLQTEWAYSRTFDGTETYPDVPNIENIFPMAGLAAGNLIAWVFTLAGGLTFSVIYRRASLLVMCGLASFFSTFGFADWNFYLLSLCWFFAVVVFLGSGEK